jgi:hypothetical protein
MSLGTIVELGEAYAQRQAEGWVLHGCPDGTASAWRAESLPKKGPARLVFESGDPKDVAGLFAVLLMLIGVDREETLEIIHPLFDEAVPSIVEAWLKSTQPDFPVSLETA